MPKLSIIMPAIRVDLWDALYNSIEQSTTKSFELIVVGPYPLTPFLQPKVNVKYIKDFGHPVRCFNIGLCACEGELVTWTSDDGTFLTGMLDKAVDTFEAMPPHPKNVLITKYMELNWTPHPDSYFKLCNAYPRVAAINDDWWIFNLIVTKTVYLQELGGCDSQFETLAFSDADLAIRAYRDGCLTQILPEPTVFNTHGHADHTPIERGHVDHDHPLYLSIHNDPQYNNRNCIDLNNWKQAARVWERRFPEFV